MSETNADMSENTTEIKKRNRRPKGTVSNMTPEEFKAYKKLYNDNRGPRKKIYKTCEVCNYECDSNNYARHCKTKKHIENTNKRMEKYDLDIRLEE